jgi:hypothetical protein
MKKHIDSSTGTLNPGRKQITTRRQSYDNHAQTWPRNSHFNKVTARDEGRTGQNYSVLKGLYITRDL